MRSRVILCITLILSTLSFANSTMIRSDRVTNWGTWGSLEQCPSGSFVKAINIKTESSQGRGDDTAMNAVQLYCVRLDDQTTSTSIRATRVLTSAAGPWGSYRGLDFCYNGVAVGFQLRSEGPLGRGDDTAANDMRLICANSNANSATRETGMGWGSWRTAKTCPPRTAICGLQTQVEPPQGRGDDTALNNVDVLCCNLPNPASTCQPSDGWQQIRHLNNLQGTTKMPYTLREKVGVQRTVDISHSSTVSEELSLSLGFSVTAGTPGVLAATFETKLGYSTSTEHTWSRKEGTVFTLETEETIQMDIPARCETTLYKVIGTCGVYVVNSNSIKRVDNCVGIQGARSKISYATIRGKHAG